ncbi:MAG: AI-2E family transporter [Phycisphaerae bacterium]
MSESPAPRRVRVYECVMIAGVVLAGLYLLRDILIPTVLAVLLAFLLAPAVRGVQRCGFRRTPAVFVVVCGAVLLLGCGAWFVATQAVELADQFATYRHSLVSKARDLRDSVAERVHPLSQTINAIQIEIAKPGPASADGSAPLASSAPASVSSGPASGSNANPAGASPSEPFHLARAILPTVLHPLAVLGLTAVLALFFLLYREDLRDRIIAAFGSAHVGLTTRMLIDAGARFGGYFTGVALVNAVTGAAIGFGLLMIGLPNALLFGVLTAALRFVPILGPWLAAVFPTVLAIAIFDGWMTPVLVVLLFVLVEACGANLLEPWVYGARVGASATAVLLSMVFWAWIWGPVGLVLATPITVCLVVLGKYIPQLQVLYVLLGSEPVLEPRARFYQRLLAVEPAEALALAHAAGGSAGAAAALDDVVLPGLGMLAGEEPRGATDSPRGAAARQVVRQIGAALALPKRDADTAAPPGDDVAPQAARSFRAALVPVHGWPDELACELVKAAMESRGGTAAIAPPLLVSELLDWIRDARPDSLCLVTVGGGTVRRLELLAARIRGAGIVPPVLVLTSGVAEPARVAARLGQLWRVTCCATVGELLRAAESSARRRSVVAGAACESSDSQDAATLGAALVVGGGDVA